LSLAVSGFRRPACVALLIALAVAPAVVWGAEDTDDDEAKLNSVVVTATRSPTLIRDEPLRVEAVPAEEIEENLTVQPGNLSSLLHELPSVRVQSVAPGLGGAGLQLRGMPARETLVLSDGLPLLGAETDAFGILQTPPLDLERVEVIKGAASALYGGSALGGVLNLVSHTADSEPAVLANVTSRGGRDLVGFFTHKDASPWSGTLTAGAHDQSAQDVNGDGWADLPGYRRYTIRPRTWWDGGEGRSLFLTAGFVDEHRTGGTLPGRVLPDGSPFPEELHTRRFDAGAVSHLPFNDGNALNGRFSVTETRLDRTFDAQRVGSTQTTIFAEEALNGTSRGHDWVLGAAFQRDQLDVAAVPGISYTYNTPAAFAQDTYAVAPWMVVGISARVDANNEYGTFVSPRLSALLREPESTWSLRASVGGGYSAPTPFLEEIESAGLGSLLPLRGLHAERAMTESLDAKWADEGWDVNVSLFDSEIRNPLGVLTSGNMLELSNAKGPQRAPGAEALIGYVVGPLHALASWSYIDASRVDPTGERGDVPLVPRQAGSLDAILESEKRGRIGLELDYTGKQALEYDPYRTRSPAYFSLNALAELRFRNIAIFVNAINLTNVRQTRWAPLIRSSPGPGGNPITDVWAPLDGRTFNLGIRAELH
jgi:outer membrane receptor for ferrienterochelin and colicins